MNNFISSIANWQFLDEPMYRWGIFFIGVSLFMGGWSAILDLMK